MYIILSIIIAIIAFCFGVFATALVMKERLFGTIKWVREEGSDPYLFLDMDKQPELMVNYKYVMFRTDLKDGYTDTKHFLKRDSRR